MKISPKEFLCYLVLFTGYLWTDAANAEGFDWAVDPIVTYTHTSDLLRGWPFGGKHEYEPTQDYIGFGVIATKRGFEVEFTHGVKGLNCRLFTGDSRDCEWQSGTNLTFRWRPFK